MATGSLGWRARSLTLVALAASVLAAGCQKPLPEEGSAAAELYRERCGGCHRAYHPGATKLPTWKMILPMMEQRMRAAGLPPLTGKERRTIVDYLRRNAG